MAYAIANTSFSNSVLNRVRTIYADLREANAKHRMFVKTMNELQALSSRELADLGLSRSNLHETAYAAVYR